MADGVVDWSNITEIHKIRQRYAQTNAVQHVQDRQKQTCIQFTRASVQGQEIMSGKIFYSDTFVGIVLQLIKKTESHSKKDCWKAAREQPKKTKQSCQI